MAKFQPFWNLKSDPKSPDVLNMYVYGEIVSYSGWFGSDTDVVASKFVKDLQAHPDVKNIHVYINSPGGEVFVASAIANQLKKHPANVEAYVDGICASAAVTLALGADKVFMSRSALMMIHNPSTRVNGDAKKIQKSVEILNKVKETIVSVYKAKTNLSDEVLSKLMDEETWLTADDALKYGFIDSIVEDSGLNVVVKNEDDFEVNGVAFSFSNFASKEQLEEKINAMKNKQGGNSNMPKTFQEILNAMSAEDQNVVNQFVTASAMAEVAKNQVTWNAEKATLQANNTALTNKVADLEKPKNANPEDAIINSMSPEAKALYLKMKSDADATAAKLAATEKATAQAAFKTKIGNDYPSLPITDEQMTALYNLSVVDAKSFTDVASLLKIANNAVDAGFQITGSDNGTSVSAATSAYAEIENKIAAKRKADPTMDYNMAFKAVTDEDPSLYEKYRDER